MRIDDVPKSLRDSPVTLALFAEKPTLEQARFLEEMRNGNGEKRITVRPPRA